MSGQKISRFNFYRPTVAIIDLDALEYNFRQIRRLVATDVKILVTVKADAYGHGILEVSKRLSVCKVDYLGVASVDEAIFLRKAGIDLPILVMGMIFAHQAKAVLDYNLTQTICSYEVAEALNRIAVRCNRKAYVHIKVDTGMGRLGVAVNEAEDFVKRVNKLRYLYIEGIFTHFPCADNDERFTKGQIRKFSRLVDNLARQGIDIPFKHAANSMGVLGYREGHFNLIRPGLIVYGLYPKERLNIKLKPVLSLKSKVVFLKSVKKGTPLSYGHTYVTGRDTTIATVPIGYADGYSRHLSNKASVLIKNKCFPVVGTICMDQILVDTGKAGIKIGDEVILIGSHAGKRISAEEIAYLSGTIPYEVVCQIGQRVPRVYKGLSI